MKKSLFITISFTISIISVLILSCSKKQDLVIENKTPFRISPNYDTILSLDKMIKDTAILKLNGKYIMVIHERSTDEEFEDEDTFPLDESGSRSTTSSSCNEQCSGLSRKGAKTSYASGATINYSNISSLRASFPTDALMQAKGLGHPSPRATEENRNVSVTSSYLYAIARESDNDYHLIIGDANASTSTLLNCEAGGLPFPSSAPSYSNMKTVRDYIKLHFGTNFCNRQGYFHFHPAIKITVLKGSLFYDIDHLPGVVGPQGYRASTAWEIHPISAITF